MPALYSLFKSKCDNFLKTLECLEFKMGSSIASSLQEKSTPIKVGELRKKDQTERPTAVWKSPAQAHRETAWRREPACHCALQAPAPCLQPVIQDVSHLLPQFGDFLLPETWGNMSKGKLRMCCLTKSGSSLSVPLIFSGAASRSSNKMTASQGILRGEHGTQWRKGTSLLSSKTSPLLPLSHLC